MLVQWTTSSCTVCSCSFNKWPSLTCNCLYLFKHWLMKQNTNEHQTNFSRTRKNCSIYTLPQSLALLMAGPTMTKTWCINDQSSRMSWSSCQNLPACCFFFLPTAAPTISKSSCWFALDLRASRKFTSVLPNRHTWKDVNMVIVYVNMKKPRIHSGQWFYNSVTFGESKRLQ